MAKRGWSLTDAQLERRKQNPAARRSIDPDAGTFRRQYQEHYAAVDRASKAKVRKQAMSRPSNTQQRRKAAGSPETGLQRGADWATHGPSQAAINFRHDNPATPIPRKLSGPPSAAEVDWTGPDALSLMNPEVATTTIRGAGGRQHDEWRERGPNLSNPYRNEYPTHPKSPRQMSTQAAYRAADASMFNSNVTPKAERAENKRPRSRMSPDQNVFW